MEKFKNYEEIENQLIADESFLDFVLREMGWFYENKVMNMLKANEFYVVFKSKQNTYHHIHNYDGYTNDVFIDKFVFNTLEDLINFEKGNSCEKDELLYWLKGLYVLDDEKDWIIFTDVDKKTSLKDCAKRIYQTFTGYDFCNGVPFVKNEVRCFWNYFYNV